MNVSFLVVMFGAAVGFVTMRSPGLAAVLLAIAGAGRLIRRWAPEDDRAFLVRLFAVAVVVRILIGAGLHLWAMHQGKGYLMYGMEAFDISGDSAYVSLRAWILTQAWRGAFDLDVLDRGIFDDQTNMLVYPYAGFYALFGFSQYAAKLINSLLGALIPLIAYAMAKSLAGRRSARIAAWLAALFPSTLLWSVTMLKETPTALGLAWATWATVRLMQQGWRWSWRVHRFCALGLLGGLGLVQVARPMLVAPLAACLAAGAACGGLVTRPTWRRVAAAALVAAAGVLAPAWCARTAPVAYWDGQTNRIMNEMVSRQKGHILSGGSAYRTYDEAAYQSTAIYTPLTFTPGQIARALVVSWAFFLLGPMPWRATSVLQVMTLPEMCLWYVLLVCAAGGMIWLVRRRRGVVMVLAVPLLVLITVLALSTGNMGVAFRHRGIFVPLFLTLSAVGLAAAREGVARHAGAVHFV